MADWKSFLVTVDGISPPDPGILENVEKYFVSLPIAAPRGVAGLVEGDIEWTKLDALPERSFARRAFRAALSAFQAVGGSPQVTSVLAVPRAMDDILEVCGPDASALAVSQAMAHGDKVIPVMDKLVEAGLEKLAFHLRADAPVWVLLDSETEAAKVAGRTPSSYVDFTSKALLPLWLPADAVGGKSITASCDWNLDASASSATLGALGSALKAATSTPKFFRSLAQWNAVFMRYAVVAVGLKQITWAAVVAHVDVVMRIAEEARLPGGCQFLAILYDDLLRRSLSDRASKKDPELKLESEFTKVNQEVLLLAKSRLDQVLNAAGMNEVVSQLASSSAHLALTASTESVLAKQAAAAEALTRKAENAVKHMAKQQDQLDNRRAAVESNRIPFKGDGKHANHRSRGQKRKGGGPQGGFNAGKGQRGGRTW